jgi:hypothetical protein
MQLYTHVSLREMLETSVFVLRSASVEFYTIVAVRKIAGAGFECPTACITSQQIN